MKLITKALESVFAKYPIYSQGGKGKDAKVLAKFFYGPFTWYVLEANKMENGKYEFFGYVEENGERELQYFYEETLESIKMWGYPVVERDMYFKPCLVSNL